MIIVISGVNGNLGSLIYQRLTGLPNLKIIGYDLNSINDFYDQLERIDVIDFFFHFGEFSHPDISLSKSILNIKSSCELLEKLNGSCKIINFVYASSHRVYGSWESWTLKLSGKDSLRAKISAMNCDELKETFYSITHYGNAKLFVENELRNLVSREEWCGHVSILRIGSILGDDLMTDVELEKIYETWSGKMDHTRVLKETFENFILKIISLGLAKDFEVLNVLPADSFLNSISSGKNFHNY